MQNENVTLAENIGHQRREIEDLVGGLATLVTDLDHSSSALPHDQMLALTQDTVAIDEELRTHG